MGGGEIRLGTDGVGSGSGGSETAGALDGALLAEGGALLATGGVTGALLAAVGGVSSSISPGGSPGRDPVRVKVPVAVVPAPARVGPPSDGGGLTEGSVAAGLAL